MVLHNGPAQRYIVRFSRHARANLTSQSTVLFPTVILAGCATLAICIGKSRYPFDATRRGAAARRASSRIVCNACMHTCTLACVPIRLRFPSAVFTRKKDSSQEATRDAVCSEINIRLRKMATTERLARRARWRERFFCCDRSYYSWLIRSLRLHLSLAGQIKRELKERLEKPRCGR